GGRETMLGSQAVIDGDDDAGRGLANVRALRVVEKRVDGSVDEAASMKVEECRMRARAFRFEDASPNAAFVDVERMVGDVRDMLDPHAPPAHLPVQLVSEHLPELGQLEAGVSFADLALPLDPRLNFWCDRHRDGFSTIAE